MFLQIAWRNIFRNKKRSLIIIAAIACGLWAALVASAVSLGFSYETVRSALETRLAHVQLHKTGFRESGNLRDTIPEGMNVAGRLKSLPHVRALCGRLLAEGMASTAETAVGVLVNGIERDQERRVTTIADRLVAGTYALGERRSAIVIGEELAQKLGVHLNSKVIVTMQEIQGNIVGGSFRVVGIYRTDSTPFDGSTVFVDRHELARLLDMDDHVHEIALVVDNLQDVGRTAADIRSLLPGMSAETWMDLAPELQYIDTYTEFFLNIFLYVIVFALLFGITNTMLMSVLDRVREIGVLTAVGMRGRKVFVMIMLESIALSALGGIAGLLAGWGTIEHLRRTGIDLAAFGEGLRQWGYSALSYPILPFSMYEQVIVSILLAAILGAIYPAWKAVRLDPAKAIRTY